MNCFDKQTYLVFLDGELSRRKENRVTKHLEKCQHCRDLVRKLQEENAEIAKLFELHHRIIDQSKQVLRQIDLTDKSDSGRQKFFPRALLPGLRIAAVVLFVSILSLFIFFRKDPAVSDSGREVLVQTANVDGHQVQTHVFGSVDRDIIFIWFEKI